MTRATPSLSWPAPAAIPVGAALTTAQLNATANVAGTFVYSPAAGTVPPAGTDTLSVTFSPADIADYAPRSATVALTVSTTTTPTPAPVPAPAPSKLAILSPTAGNSVSGAITVTTQCALSLDAAGSYLMLDGVEVGSRRVTAAPYLYSLDTTTLPNGPHTLQIWAHDISNNTTISAPVVIQVSN